MKDRRFKEAIVDLDEAVRALRAVADEHAVFIKDETARVVEEAERLRIVIDAIHRGVVPACKDLARAARNGNAKDWQLAEDALVAIGEQWLRTEDEDAK